MAEVISGFRYLSEAQTWKKPGFLNLFKTTPLNHIFKLTTALISLTCTTALKCYDWDVSRTLDRLVCAAMVKRKAHCAGKHSDS